MKEYCLRTLSVSKKYGRTTVLDHVNLNIGKGEIYGLIGRNGAGKTTLIRIIAGLVKTTNGSIELFGKTKEKELRVERKRMGALIEMPVMYGDMTAEENLEFIRLQKGIPGKKCIQEKLNLVGLSEVKKKKVKNFSLGMKQKLGIAMALLGDPEFIILDEPTNGLDPMGIVEMRELLKKINKEEGVTILVSSHMLSELYQLVTCFGILHNGQIIEEIQKEVLDERCKKAVELKVDDVKKAVWILETILKTTNYTVLSDEVIKLYDYIEEPELVSTALSKEQVMVKQIAIKGEELESYFMNLVGGEKNV
ncbi:MAG: ATP-binding cassette domain-containing protein [bacterium]|nr:ATP-binding cassette domain-containing protein [bacterium]